VHPSRAISLTPGEASAYLEKAGDDELRAAMLLAHDRCELAESPDPPDAEEIHHALFLLRRARGLPAPSFDTMRVELRAKLAA
jgi:hypothetical protein